MKRLLILSTAALMMLAAHAALPFKNGDSIAFLGDSITQLGTDNPKGWVNLVERAIRAEVPEVAFVHAGISGNKSSHMIVRYEGDVVHRKPNWMFFSCGVNDAPNGLTGRSRNRGLPLAAYKANVETILDWAKEDGTQVIVLSQTPVVETPTDHVANRNLEAYNAVLKEAALARGLIYLDPGAAIRAEIAKKSDPSVLTLTTDGTHPNVAGNAIIAKTVLDGLNAWCARSDKAASVMPAAPGCGADEWRGVRVGVLGDSITDPGQCASQRVYWNYLTDWLGWKTGVYGISGHAWKHIPGQTDRMIAEMGDDVDAIFIFIGTNDYCSGIPLGEWYEENEGTVNWWGKERTLRRRTFNRNPNTVRGAINLALEKLKKRYPHQQIILLTPIHRAYFTCSPTNVQPAEDWCNTAGLYLESYVDCVREAGRIWSCPVIDLYAESGLVPLTEEYLQFFRSAEKDGLHPNSEGHLRLARTIFRRLMSLPATFR